MTLRYPLEIGGVQDYIQFKPEKYKANNATVNAAGGAAPGSSGAQDVILYMPNSTPVVGNENNWGPVNFQGPLGNIQKLAGAGVANVIDSQSSLDPGETINNIKNQFSKLSENATAGGAGAAAKQLGLQLVPQQIFGATGAQLLAMSRGKVFNPNVELLYTAPGMRSFNFTFKFVPKSSNEASRVNQIIRNFKKWSAPEELENGMLAVPHVWNVQYMTQGRENDNMNKFKKAACTSVTVQQTPKRPCTWRLKTVCLLRR